MWQPVRIFQQIFDKIEDAVQNVYMGNQFLALRKSEVTKVAPDRAAFFATGLRAEAASKKAVTSVAVRIGSQTVTKKIYTMQKGKSQGRELMLRG